MLTSDVNRTDRTVTYYDTRVPGLKAIVKKEAVTWRVEIEADVIATPENMHRFVAALRAAVQAATELNEGPEPYTEQRMFAPEPVELYDYEDRGSYVPA